ncbi:MAG TPA: CHAT domain-containing protein, partial [Thermoanaerobaculia bacterium]|nr:CHAT domain-containing protein [Thermoanaerobaculia bacterium]
MLKSPFGEGVVGFSLPEPPSPPAAVCAPSAESSRGALGAGTSRDIALRSVASPFGGRLPLEIGTELYRSVFQGQVRSLLDKSRGQLEISPNLGLRLKIKLDPGDEDAGALADLPWELLCDGETDEYFALSRQMSVVRYLDVPRSSQPIPFTQPLRILAVGASPKGMEPLDLAEEARRLEDLNGGGSGVEVRFLTHASAGAVREALSGDTYNVLHFMGHGTFDDGSGEGMLAFEGQDGSPSLVSGKGFATKLRDLRSLGVVVLNACNTARSRHQRGASPFRGVATALVLGGVPAVVAMQRPISDLAAIGFSAAFYRNLARGDSIDEALTEGRQAIHSARPEDFEWATPVLFLRMPEGNVFVAKPAGRPEEIALPQLPAPAPAAAPIAPAIPHPASSTRGPVLKITAGAVATALVLIGIYTATSNSRWKSGPQDVVQQETLTTNLEPKPEAGGDLDANLRVATKPRRSRVAEDKAADLTPSDSPVQHASLPPPAPSPTPVAELAETFGATADLTSLSAQVISIARREEDGLRVTVSFRNAAALPLSAVLDAESSVLSDDQGQRYSVLDFDLPVADSNPRLDLAAGATSRHTFDFPAPKLGSKEFVLTLWTLN